MGETMTRGLFGSTPPVDKVTTRAFPRHIAIIMDGNGRWAECRGEARWEGHSAGAKAVRRTLESACRLGLPYLTLYAFSVNNWRRPKLEVEALMRLLKHFAEKERAELIQQNVRVQVIGRKSDLPARTERALDDLILATEGCTGTTLTLALSYGGRDDVARAAQSLAAQVAQGTLRPEDVTEETLRRAMSTRVLPDVDLLIRTGGESRVSDFLLLEAAYAELHFLPIMWPEFSEHHLVEAIERFQGVERRFGLTGEQVAAEAPKRASA
jgi:undecaprenyl diphosphate synthase